MHFPETIKKHGVKRITKTRKVSQEDLSLKNWKTIEQDDRQGKLVERLRLDDAGDTVWLERLAFIDSLNAFRVTAGESAKHLRLHSETIYDSSKHMKTTVYYLRSRNLEQSVKSYYNEEWRLQRRDCYLDRKLFFIKKFYYKEKYYIINTFNDKNETKPISIDSITFDDEGRKDEVFRKWNRNRNYSKKENYDYNNQDQLIKHTMSKGRMGVNKEIFLYSGDLVVQKKTIQTLGFLPFGLKNIDVWTYDYYE